MVYRSLLAAVSFTLICSACNCGNTYIIDGGEPDSGHAGGGTTGTGGGTAGIGGGTAGVGGGDPNCIPPDVMIALDRTLTMHFRPDGTNPTDAPAYATSKWAMAISGIEQLAVPPVDQGVRFGLELWPKEEPGCVTLAQRVENTANATNAICEGPEIVIEPALGTGAQIATTLDPATTKICLSTPTGSALIGAGAFLQAHREAQRKQFVVLVTDGADWDQSCPTPNPLEVVDTLTDAGIATLIVGFSADSSLQSGGVGAGFLNNMACAGGTARGFANACETNDAGVYRAKPGDAGTLFYVATDTQQLVSSLRDFTKTVCCGDCIN